MHPGGSHVFLEDNVGGQDCSKIFFSLHRSEILEKYARYRIGLIENEKPIYVLPVRGNGIHI